MLAYYTKRSPGEEFEQLKQPLKSGMWIDGSHLTVEEIDKVVLQHGLNPNIVYDVRDRQELPRVEVEKKDVYVFLRLPRLSNSGRVLTAPLLCIIQPENFLSLSTHATPPPDEVAAAPMPKHAVQTTELLLGVIVAAVNAYENLLKHTERSINDTGARLKTHEVTNKDFIHFVVVEDNLGSFRMNLEGIQAVVRRLQGMNHGMMNAATSEALDDIDLQIQQLLVAIASYGNRVESIRNAYSTIANNNLNRRMKTLTVFTVLITLPNVFYGMYGMNVALPFETEPWAYFAVVGFTLALTCLVYVVAKRFKIF